MGDTYIQRGKETDQRKEEWSIQELTQAVQVITNG